MSKLKQYIKIVTYANFPFGGAAANFVRYFSLAINNENNTAEVILPTGYFYGKNIYSGLTRSGISGTVKFRYLGFLFHPHNYFGKIADNVFGMFLPLFYFIHQKFRGRVDKIILYDVSSFFNTLLFVLIKKSLRIKLIIILPEFYEKPSKKISIGFVKWYSFYFALKYLIRYADGFITLTSFLKNYVNNRLHIKKEILILPNLMDPDIFKSDRPAFINEKITIGYVGTPVRKDGVIDLIKSFASLHKESTNTHLLIIGDITNGKTVVPILKQFAKELGVEDNITFTGLISFNEVPDLLNSCQILALTRPFGAFAEAGFPTKLGEYFACKKPVVVTKVGDIPLYFKNQVDAILVEPENIQDIVSGFMVLIDNKPLMNAISENAFKWMNDNLNYRNVSAKLVSFIDQVK